MAGEKRRGGSSSHVIRTTPLSKAGSAAMPASASSSSTPALTAAAGKNRAGNNNGNSTISPPPRVALANSGTNSSATDDGTGDNTPAPALVRARTPTPNNNVAAGGPHREFDRGYGGNHEDNHHDALRQQVADLKRDLDKLSQNESEAASFWQQRHSALNQQFMAADADLRGLRAQLEELRCERDDLRAGWDATRRELASREREAAELRSQVRGLKDWLATSTRSAGVAPADDVFADGFSRLSNGLQNWLINHFRRAKLDLSRVDAATLEELSALVPTYAELTSTAKLPLLQSLVSRILVDMIFNNYFVGLNEAQALQLARTESLVASLVTGQEPVNQWRSTTLTLLSKEAPHTMQEEMARLTDGIVARVNRLLGALSPDYAAAVSSGAGVGGSSSSSNATASAAMAGGAAPPPPPPPRSSTPAPSEASREHSLRQLIASSIELARLLAVQRASFHVFLPEASASASAPDGPGDGADGEGDVSMGDDDQGRQRRQARRPLLLFDPALMEDVGGLDEEALAGAEVRCATFPGILKRGDEAGGHLQQYENVISKARVLCNPAR